MIVLHAGKANGLSEAAGAKHGQAKATVEGVRQRMRDTQVGAPGTYYIYTKTKTKTKTKTAAFWSVHSPMLPLTNDGRVWGVPMVA